MAEGYNHEYCHLRLKKVKRFFFLTHRTTVGNSSAENTKMASKEFMTENFPIIAKIIRPATNPTKDNNIRKRNAVNKDL